MDLPGGLLGHRTRDEFSGKVSRRAVETAMDGPSADSLLRINLGPFNHSAQPVEKIDFVIHWNDNTWNNISGQDFHILFTTTSLPTGESLPTEYRLSQNYPNPFNPATEIGYEPPAASDVRLSVFDLLGRQVTLLVNTRQ